MNRIPERHRPLVVGVTAAAAVLLVAAGVLFLGRLGPSPNPTSAPTSSPSVSSPSAEPSTPEGATRSFFDALIEARRRDDPSPIAPFVTGEKSSAYRTVAGFLQGQREAGKASVTTMLQLEEVSVEETTDGARLTATLYEAGYDIDLDTGEPLESPITLEPRALTVELRRVEGEWKVDSFEIGPGSPSR